MILLLSFAFLSGLVTILTPCIWPLLPIILAANVGGKGHQRPLGITLGIIISFAFFTLAISFLIKIFHFDPNSLRLLAVVVIGFLGITMIIPAISRFTELFISRMTSIFDLRKLLFLLSCLHYTPVFKNFLFILQILKQVQDDKEIIQR